MFSGLVRWIKGLFKEKKEYVYTIPKVKPHCVKTYIPDADLTLNMPIQGRYRDGYPVGAVIHYTAGRSANDTDAVNTVTDAASRGLNFITIARSGKIYQGAPLDKWGWHTGPAHWDGLDTPLSGQLVGIELCCAGKLQISRKGYFSHYGECFQGTDVRFSSSKDVVAGCYHKFSKEQEDALIKLLFWLKENNPVVFDFKYVLGHDEISPGRKSDPGASLSMSMSDLRELLRQKYDSRG